MTTWSIVGPILLLFIGCYYSALYFSLRNYSRLRLEEILSVKNRLHRLSFLQDNLHQLILIASVIRMSSNIALVTWLIWLFSENTLTTWTLTQAFIVALILLSIFSVAIPNALAKHFPESLLAVSIPILKLSQKVTYPLIILVSAIEIFVQRLSGINPEMQEAQKAEKEILEAIQEGEDEGVVEPQERKMIESVITLRSTNVGQIMTPRTEIVAIDVNSTLAEIKSVIIEHGHSRMPIYEENLDNIIGMLYVKDLLRYLGNTAEGFSIRDVTRSCYFVPETKSLREIFREFRSKKIHIAIVLDEYGGTLGVVSFEDVIEQIVGQIADEYELGDVPLIRQIDSKTFEADGRMRTDEMNDEYNLQIPQSEHYETISGFLFSEIGRIPATSETYQYQNLLFTIMDATERKINRVRVEILPGKISSSQN